MKRYHEEQHIIERRLREHRNLFDDRFRNVNTPAGAYRKAIRCSGCGRARCQVCHPEKFPRRVPTRQEKLPWGDGH